MATILVVLFFITLISFIGFMLSPKEAEKAFSKQLSRKQIAIVFGSILLVLLIGIGIIGASKQQSENDQTTNEPSASEKPATEALNSSGETSKLDESTRKQICYDLALAQDKATNEADQKYPIDISSNPNAKDNVEANSKLVRELTDKYEADVREQYSIDKDTQASIVAECVENDWPLP